MRVSSFARKGDTGTANTGRGKNLDPENSLNDHLETGTKSKWVVPINTFAKREVERIRLL